MNLAKPFIHRPVMTTLLMLPMIVFGIYAYKLLPVSTIPFIEPPIIMVTANYPGASPDKVAVRVAGPLEREFMLMQGIEFVTSENDYEQTTIVLQFHNSVDINVAAIETQNAIDKAAGQLPGNLPNPPVYTKTNPSDTPILYCVLHSNVVPASDLYEYAYTFLGQQLGTVNGVSNITTYGYPYAVRVEVDPEALAAKGITLKEVADTINNENPDQPTGKYYGPNKSIFTKVNGQVYKARNYNPLIIKYYDDKPVRIQDIGTAKHSLQNDKVGFKWITNDKREDEVVVLAIYKQQGFNTMQVCTQVEQLLDKLSKDLPASMEFEIPFTQSTYISESVREVEMTLLIAFLLVVIVVFVYLGKVRNSVIPLITLPITITGTFVLMYLFGYSIDIMSMSALTLAIGFLVDDAIVVLENIVRHVEMGDSPYKGSMRGTKQIIMAVVSISLCLALVFVPLLFMSGMVGAIFHEFAGVILISILFSAFISLSLTPMLCSRFVPPHDSEKKSKVELFSEKINETLLKYYKPALIWSLNHKLKVVVFCILNLGASIYLFITLPKEFLPKNDLGVVQGFLVTDASTSPEKLDVISTHLEKICMANPYVYTMARMSSTPTDNQAMFFLNLVEPKKRPSVWKVIDQLQAAIHEEMVGVLSFMKSFPLINLQIGGITAGKGDFQYILQSINPDLLYEKAPEFINALKLRPELSQVSSDLLPPAPTLTMDVLRDQGHAYNNLNATNIEEALMFAYGETYISKINEPQNMYYVILEGTNNAIRDPSKLNLLYTGRMATGTQEEENFKTIKEQRQTAIDSIVDAKILPGPLEVNHINTMNSVTISFNVNKDFALSDAIAAVEEEAAKMIPDGIMKNLAGNTAAFKQTFEELTILLLLAIFVIYVILGILYENFLHPLVPLSALPVAVFGGLLTLLICNEMLSVYALIGLIMLIGIVMKNGILIVGFAFQEYHENKMSPYDSVISACMIRFRPIIMTTFAAMMGSVPIALGVGGTIAKGRAPLGLVVVGGLLFSQLITLFVIPCFYIYMHQLQAYFQKRYKICRPISLDEKIED